jgi:cytosine/adenosine deaminase-related metal-dependent hydrolase
VTRPAAPAVTLRARWLLPVGSPPIDGGWIRIERGRVAALGRREPPGIVRDLGDAIILPGLVNAHTHLEFSDRSAPLDPAGGLPAWIERVVALRRSRVQAADAESIDAEAARTLRAISGGLAESAAAGVTTIGEIATSAPIASYAQFAAYTQFGPRIRVYREGLGLSAEASAAAHRAVVRDLDLLRATGVPAGISPHAPYSVAAPLGRQLIAAAVARGLPVAMHLAESREEAELVASGSGRFRAVLEALGAWQRDRPPRLLTVADWITSLAKAPRGIVVHGTHLPDDPAALARLTRHRDRLAVVICPRTTKALSGALPPLAAFRAAGVRVALGTDSRASNPDLSVLAECRTLVDAGLASPAEVIRMATVEAAWSLGFEARAGRLAIGRPADLAILRPTRAAGEPHEAALAPDTQVLTTLRSGRPISE